MLLLATMVGCGSGDLGGSSGSSPALRAAREAEPGAQVGPLTVNLNAGWNGVGFQASSLSSVTSPVVAGLAHYDGTAYQTLSLTPDEINSGEGTRRGFWAFATGPGTLTYSGSDSSSATIALRSGWNLVNFPTTTSLPGSSLVCRRGGQIVPLASVVLPQFQQLGANNAYTTVDVSAGGSLAPGRPCWVFSLEVVSLGFGSPGPSPSATATPTPGVSPSPGGGRFTLTNVTVDPPDTPIFTDGLQGYNVTYSNGDVSYYVWNQNGPGLPRGHLSMRCTWGQPPSSLSPGIVWPMSATATMVDNTGMIGEAGVSARVEGGEYVFPLGASSQSLIRVNETNPTGYSVTKAATGRVPNGGTDFVMYVNAPGGNAQWNAQYRYHYKWTP